MCRLVAYLGEPLSPEPLVYGGSHSLHRQSWAPREMLSGSVNADGFGIVWYHEGRPARLARAYPIWRDGDLPGLLRAVQSGTVVAALRNVTPGIPASDEGVPPLALDRWAFVLNGYLTDFRRRFMRDLHGRLSGSLHAELRGVSDTEALFLLAVARLREGAGPGEALREVVREAREAALREGVEAQLNLVLADGRSLAATRASSVEATNSLYVARAPALAPGGIVLASEPPDADPAWAPVPPQTLVEVRDGEVRVEPLE